MKTLVVSCDLLTAYGRGIDLCWQSLLSGASAISRVRRFDTRPHATSFAGIIPGLDATLSDSLCMQMLTPMLREARSQIPTDALVMLASTGGEVDLLERSILRCDTPAEESCLTRLLAKIQSILANNSQGLVVSAACGSSTAAVALAAAMIREGREQCVAVVTCDSVTEFVFAGFSSLRALAESPAAPFDRDRTGLSIGEAAAYALLMSEERALRERRSSRGEVVGWGFSNDVNHMTGPSADGNGLAAAILHALKASGVRKEEVDSICAHGTGTRYNDAMEMKAFRRVFGDRPVPTYSIKGAIGHTLGAAGLVEMIVALRSLEEKVVPPTVGCRCPDPSARGWVTLDAESLAHSRYALSTSSGFGGINVALLLRAIPGGLSAP